MNTVDIRPDHHVTLLWCHRNNVLCDTVVVFIQKMWFKWSQLMMVCPCELIALVKQFHGYRQGL